MERKHFQSLVDARPDYRAWLHCADPEEKALRQELLERLTRLSSCAAAVRRTPMPAALNDAYLSRASLHIDQDTAFHAFAETLFEYCLRQDSRETLELLFSFLETYASLLEAELTPPCLPPAGQT